MYKWIYISMNDKTAQEDVRFIRNIVEILSEMTAYIINNTPEIRFIHVTTDYVHISKYYERAVADHDLWKRPRELAEIFNGVGLLRGGGRQVGTTGKLPESSVEYNNVQIFTRDRFGVTKREGRKRKRREREKEREIKRKATYNNYPP